MDPSVRIREHELRSDGFLRLRLGGRKKRSKSSSAGVALVGRHLLRACTRKQKIIARSSAEAELYAAASVASEAKGVESMMRDLGFAVKPVSATEHTLHRRGVGKMKHIDVAHL